MFNTAEGWTVAFTQVSFSCLSDIHECLGGLQMASCSLDKQIADCDLPHDWIMSLVMDLAALCDTWGENGTNGCYLAVITEDIDFALHFVALRSPFILPPYRSASGIGYTNKNYLKIAGNSASYPVYSGHSELSWMAIYLWRNTCKQLYLFLRYIKLNISKLYL